MARIPLAINLESRTGGVANARVVNGYVEKSVTGELKVFKRPALTLIENNFDTFGLGIFVPPLTTDGQPTQNGTETLYSVGAQSTSNAGTLAAITSPNYPSGLTFHRWTNGAAGNAYNFDDNGTVDQPAPNNRDVCLAAYGSIRWGNASTLEARLCVALGSDGTWYVAGPDNNPTEYAQEQMIEGNHDPDGNGKVVITSGSDSGEVVTSIGSMVTAGWDLASFATDADGDIFIKFPTAAYTYDGSSLTLVNDAQYPSFTVRGVVYLNGYFYVMDRAGAIYNSTEDNPTSWPGDFLTAEFEADGGVCLAKHGQYVIALGKYTTEAFYDAGNSPGSPLSPVETGVLLIGCAHANSVAQIESSLVWVAQQKGQDSTAQRGRFVVVLEGFNHRRISTPDIERILDADDFLEVYGVVVTIAGRAMYVLSLMDTDITLVFDFTSGLWYEWLYATEGSDVSVTSLTQSSGTATATTSSAHGFSDGDQVTIAGASPAGYNQTVNVTVTGLTTFTYPVSSALSTPATGTITATGYSLGAFDMVASCYFNNQQVVQRRTTGAIYSLQPTGTSDNGSPIDFSIVTPLIDDGNNNVKAMAWLELIGDKVDTTVLMRTTDDDYASWSKYRRFDNDLQRVGGARWGSYRRRAIQLRQTLAAQVRYTAMEYKGG